MFAGGSGKANGERDARAQLVEQSKKLRDEMRPHQDERRRLFDSKNRIRDELKRKTGEVQEAKDRLPFRTIPEMETRVRELEAQIETGQYKLIEEKQILAEISKLKKARRALESIDGASSDVGTMKLRLDKLNTEISAKDDVIAKYRAELDGISKKLDEMAGSRKEAQQERDARQALIDKAKKDIEEGRKEKQALYDELKVAKRAQAEARVKREARRAEMDRRRELEDKLENLEEKLLAFNPETATDRKVSECNNLKAFFQELTGSPGEKDQSGDDKVTDVEKGVRKVQLSEELADAISINKKDKNDDFFVAKGGKKNHQKTTTVASTGTPSASFAKLPFHILSALADLSLPIPSAASDLPKLFEAIEKKKTAISSKQDDAAAEMEKKRQVLEKEIADLKAELAKPIKVKTEEAPQN